MTEKIQFDFKDEYITLNGGVFATARTKLDAERISKVINELLEENEQLHQEINKLTDLLAEELEKNARLLQETNSLKIENMRLNESIKDLNDVLARYEEKELKE